MRYRWMFTIVALMLPGMVEARPYGWTAWLHYGRHLTLVNAAGESLREVDLPLPDGDSSMDKTIAVSPSGRLAAYLIRAGLKSAEVMVYDLEQGTLQTEYALELDGSLWGTSWAFASPQMFSPDEDELAFGYTTFHEASLSADWTLIVLNLKSGKPIYHLNQIDGVDKRLTLTPIIRRYQDAEITFILEQLETDGGPMPFIWNTASQTVRPTLMFPNLQSDLLPTTGEIVSPMFGDSPLAIPELPPAENRIVVYDPILGGRYPFYVMGDSLPERTVFVQNGEAILVQAAEKWILLGRDGVVLSHFDLAPNMPIVSLKGVPDGFLYTTSLTMPDQPTMLPIPVLAMVDTVGGKLDAGRPVWYISLEEYWKRTGGQDVPMEIAWVHSDAPASSFVPWAQVAAPVYESIVTENLPPPTLIPTPEALFQVGMTVHVQTTGGEILNLRRDPSRKAEVIMYLEDDMKLTLLEGPLQAEGFVWWRVRTADGVEGWTVESNGELQTLMPG